MYDHSDVGKDMRTRNFMRTFFSSWKYHTKDAKALKQKKLTEYYQDKLDELERSHSNYKMYL